MTISAAQFAQLSGCTTSPEGLITQIRRSPAAALLLERVRQVVPDLSAIPQTTYTLYREFEHSGLRDRYQSVYFMKRAQLTRAVLETILGDEGLLDTVQDLLWSICEETSWLVPAHEEQGPDFWDLKPSPRQGPWGSNTALTREPDAIDLFAAETGAALAETLFLLGDRLAPEVRQRVRQEVDRHIFKPYLAYGRKHWWYRGALNWNGVCNGSIGLAFIHLQNDPHVLAEGLNMALEDLEAYIATGFEADGGSIEGPSYWDYGMMYFVTLAELLWERSGGAVNLLSGPRIQAVARYPLGMALAPGTYINFGDAPEQAALRPGIVQRLSERTGVRELRGLILGIENWGAGMYPVAKLPITLRDIAWWDGEVQPFPQASREDFFLPDCAVIKNTGTSSTGQPVVLAAKAGHNDGHHSHTDIGTFIYHVDGESLLCDPGRGLYSREYFREHRYENFFNNSLSHNVPLIDGKRQQPGPEFGGTHQYHGKIVERGMHGSEKRVVIDYHQAYDLPDLAQARRTLVLDAATGVTLLVDAFTFSGRPLDVEEAFVTWFPVKALGAEVWVQGSRSAVKLEIEDPAGAFFVLQDMAAECRANRREGVLTRLAVNLPNGTRRFQLRITPTGAQM